MVNAGCCYIYDTNLEGKQSAHSGYTSCHHLAHAKYLAYFNYACISITYTLNLEPHFGHHICQLLPLNNLENVLPAQMHAQSIGNCRGLTGVDIVGI